MNRWTIFWNHLRGHTCHTCAHLDRFWSSGDGQVSKHHAFCRNPASPYGNRPIPPEAWRPHYAPRKAESQRER